VVVSPSWRAQVNSAGVSFPRYEAEAALRRNLQIIPVLVGAMVTPTEQELPETLRPLLRRNIRPVRAESFDYDMEWVRRALGVQRGRRRSLVTALSALLLIAIILAGLSQAPAGNPVWRALHPASPTSNPTLNPGPSDGGSGPVPSSTVPTPPQTGPTTPASPTRRPEGTGYPAFAGDYCDEFVRAWQDQYQDRVADLSTAQIAATVFGITPPSHYRNDWGPTGNGAMCTITDTDRGNAQVIQIFVTKQTGRPGAITSVTI
jgi:hypothetical protein